MKLSHYQIFPVTDNTFQGTATNEPVRSHRVVRAVEDGDITFTFPGTTKTIAAVAGEDYLAGDGCTSITSVAAIAMS